MTIQEIYNAFDAVGCLSFTSINDVGEPESRIAHLRAFDDEGLYFMTMFTKDFYKQLKKHETISLCGLNANTGITHDAQGMPQFSAGYAIRMTGTVREVSLEDIIEKNNPLFDFCIQDQKRYPAMVVFCITSGRGDIFDYDFKKQKRNNKLQRIYFSYNGASILYKGLHIEQDKCISCGLCQKKCSFLAISQTDGHYHIDKHRCDECGDCFLHCPVQAITHERVSVDDRA